MANLYDIVVKNEHGYIHYEAVDTFGNIITTGDTRQEVEYDLKQERCV